MRLHANISYGNPIDWELQALISEALACDISQHLVHLQEDDSGFRYSLSAYVRMDAVVLHNE